MDFIKLIFLFSLGTYSFVEVDGIFSSDNVGNGAAGLARGALGFGVRHCCDKLD
jgi:hypothetical protein